MSRCSNLFLREEKRNTDSALSFDASSRFSGYLDGMLEIERNQEDQSRSQADLVLQKYEKVCCGFILIPHRECPASLIRSCYVSFFRQDLSIRQFLLTNSIHKNKKITFRVPLETLKAAIPELAKFPFTVRSLRFLRVSARATWLTPPFSSRNSLERFPGTVPHYLFEVLNRLTSPRRTFQQRRAFSRTWFVRFRVSLLLRDTDRSCFSFL